MKETSQGREAPLWIPSSQHASGKATASSPKFKRNQKLNLCVYVLKHQHKSILPSEVLPTLRVLLACDERQDGLGVVVGLLLTGSTRVLPVVGQLIHTTQVTDGVAEGVTHRVMVGPHKSLILQDPLRLKANFHQIRHGSVMFHTATPTESGPDMLRLRHCQQRHRTGHCLNSENLPQPIQTFEIKYFFIIPF